MFGRRKTQNGDGSEIVVSPISAVTSSDLAAGIIGFDPDEPADHSPPTERPTGEPPREASPVAAVDAHADARESHDEDGKARPNDASESAPPTPGMLARHISE